MDPTTNPPPQSQPPAPAPQPPAPQPQPDYSSLWEKGHSRGVEKGRAETLAELKLIFGTDDIEALRGMAGKIKSPAPPPEQYVQEIKNWQEKAAKAEADLQKIKTETAQRLVESEIAKAIAEAAPIHPSVERMVTADITGLYDIRDGLLFKRGTEIPVYFEGMQTQAKLSDAIKRMAAGEYKLFFRQDARVGHLPDATGVTPDMRVATKEESTNPQFVQAARASGQIAALFAGQPLNIAMVHKFLK